MRLIFALVYIVFASGSAQRFGDSENEDLFRVKLTGERMGPPLGADFVRIPVVSNIPDFALRPAAPAPLKGRPPPPPPVLMPRPTRRPRPSTFGPIAPPPLPIPVSISQEIPVGSDGSGGLPPLPLGVTVVTPPSEIRPDLETMATTPLPPPTTTPNTADADPAIYQRFQQNDDGSYFYDFESTNHIKLFEQGFFKHDNVLEQPILVKTGMYSFISPEGIPFRTDYVADERGYRTFRSFLPQSPDQQRNSNF